MNDNQPGQLIVPHGDDPKPPVGDVPEPAERPAEQPEPAPAPLSPSQAPDPAPVAPQPFDSAQSEAANWEYRPQARVQLPTVSQEITWTASEFIEHQKGSAWYTAVILGGVVFAALVYLITRDKISAGVIIVVVLGFVLYAGRRPRVQDYRLTTNQVQIGTKVYNIHDFKTFSIAEEGAIISVVFMPLKRFMPPLTLYVAPDVEERVVDFLSSFLPFEQFKDTITDNLMRRIRF